jgi:hypothetical protein
VTADRPRAVPSGSASSRLQVLTAMDDPRRACPVTLCEAADPAAPATPHLEVRAPARTSTEAPGRARRLTALNVKGEVRRLTSLLR